MQSAADFGSVAAVFDADRVVNMIVVLIYRVGVEDVLGFGQMGN